MPKSGVDTVTLEPKGSEAACVAASVVTTLCTAAKLPVAGELAPVAVDDCCDVALMTLFRAAPIAWRPEGESAVGGVVANTDRPLTADDKPSASKPPPLVANDGEVSAATALAAAAAAPGVEASVAELEVLSAPASAPRSCFCTVAVLLVTFVPLDPKADRSRAPLATAWTAKPADALAPSALA
jgi:hypothetical protein